MGLQDENGEVYYGADAFEQLSARCTMLLPFAILVKIPGVIYLARYIYGIVARDRIRFGCGADGSCSMPTTQSKSSGK